MNRKGFAPIEMLVAVMILDAIVLGGVYLFTQNQTKSQNPIMPTPAMPMSPVSDTTSTQASILAVVETTSSFSNDLTQYDNKTFNLQLQFPRSSKFTESPTYITDLGPIRSPDYAFQIDNLIFTIAVNSGTREGAAGYLQQYMDIAIHGDPNASSNAAEGLAVGCTREILDIKQNISAVSCAGEGGRNFYALIPGDKYDIFIAAHYIFNEGEILSILKTLKFNSKSVGAVAAATPAAIKLGACASIVPSSLLDSNEATQTSSIKNWNVVFVSVPTEAISPYCLLYPTSWKTTIVGIAHRNLAMVDGTVNDPNGDYDISSINGRVLLLLSSETTSPVSPEAIMSPGETMSYSRVETIGDKKVQHVISELGGLTYNRYIVWHAGASYVFQSRIPAALVNDSAYKQFLTTTLAIVSSTQFVR